MKFSFVGVKEFNNSTLDVVMIVVVAAGIRRRLVLLLQGAKKVDSVGRAAVENHRLSVRES